MEFLVDDNVRRVSGWNGGPQVEGYEGTVTRIEPDGTRGLSDGFELVFPTIEEGKFYRTRDGRKVGPMYRTGSPLAGHYWGAPDLEDARGLGSRWHKTGEFYKRGDEAFSDRSFAMDLVAEWALVIEAGKFYKTRDGRTVGPAVAKLYNFFDLGNEFAECHFSDGRYREKPSEHDLVAEAAPAEPVRTVTREEIVPGVYAGIRVEHSPAVGFVAISLEAGTFDADELEAASSVLLKLAKAVRQ